MATSVMTTKELIAHLQKYPADTKVQFEVKVEGEKGSEPASFSRFHHVGNDTVVFKLVKHVVRSESGNGGTA